MRNNTLPFTFPQNMQPCNTGDLPYTAKNLLFYSVPLTKMKDIFGVPGVHYILFILWGIHN